MTIVADEYHGDGFRTVYTTYVQHSPMIWQKADEGTGSSSNESWFRVASPRARAAGLKVGAYEYLLFSRDGTAQAQTLLRVAPDADAYAVDVEDRLNEGASAAAVRACCNAFEAEFYRQRPDKPLIAYGRAEFVAKGLAWTSCFRDGRTLGWVPRYNGTTLRTSNMGNTMSDFGLPQNRVAMWQFTNGTDGPQPHTLAGLNRNEDLSLLLVPLETIIEQEDDVTPEQAKTIKEAEAFLRGLTETLGAKTDPSKPATPAGAALRLAASVKQSEKGGTVGPQGPPGPPGPPAKLPRTERVTITREQS